MMEKIITIGRTNNNNAIMNKEKNIPVFRFIRMKLLLPFIMFGIIYQQYHSIRLSLFIISNTNNNDSIITTPIETLQQWKSHYRKRRILTLNNNSTQLSQKEDIINNNSKQHYYDFDTNTIITSKRIHNKGFGICLMLKEDNEILYEWLAYHYITLPLIYIVIGNDINNSQNPNNVLKRWDIVNDFTYHIIQISDIINNTTYNNQYEQNLYNKIIVKRNKGNDALKKRKIKKRRNVESDDDDDKEDEVTEDEESDGKHDNINNNNNQDVNTSSNNNNNNNRTLTLTSKEIHDIHVDLLVYRQNIFTNICMEHMMKNRYIATSSGIQQEIVWVTMIDTDEFLVLNRWDDTFDNNITIINNTDNVSSMKGQQRKRNRQKTITKEMYQLRKYHLPSNNNTDTDNELVTALDILQKLDNQSSSTKIQNNNNNILPMNHSQNNNIEQEQTLPDIHLPTCYTMPRLWMSAIENENECQQSIPAKEWIKNTIPTRYQYLKTIRYFQHTGKNNLRLNLGKVMIRLVDFIHYRQNVNSTSTSLSTDSITTTTKKGRRRIRKLKKKSGNIHCPYTDICNKKAIDITDSIFYIIHYMGSWEQYNNRTNDLRRQNNYDDYNHRAYINRGSICHTNYEIYNWILYFDNHFIITNTTHNNISHIQYLLGY